MSVSDDDDDAVVANVSRRWLQEQPTIAALNGRHLVASSPIAVGQVILAEQPYAHVLYTDQLSARCDVTLRQDGLLRCSGCKTIW